MVLPQWIDLDGRLAGLQELPVVLQFRSVDLCPCFDKALLWPGNTAAEAFDSVYREDCSCSW
jgi:hypothetical protein